VSLQSELLASAVLQKHTWPARVPANDVADRVYPRLSAMLPLQCPSCSRSGLLIFWRATGFPHRHRLHNPRVQGKTVFLTGPGVEVRETPGCTPEELQELVPVPLNTAAGGSAD
jgi:hypothetical protein